MEVPEELLPFAAASRFDRGELTVEVLPGQVIEACRVLKSQLGFERCSTITAVDRFPSQPRFEIVYHLHSVRNNRRIRLKARLDDGQEIDSVTSVWRGADWYEREVFDLFGVTFRGHPDLRRIMMPDDWQGSPLRKDYPVVGYK
ncbi:MAG: NADH-quinone oxidoreductase subunit C [Bryobacteraceae bacterium]